jgi:hypothetical protein
MDVIMESMKKKNKSDEKFRDILRKKLFDMYEEDTNAFFQDEDLYYNRVLASCNRILKILRAHSTSIDSMEKKVNKMAKTATGGGDGNNQRNNNSRANGRYNQGKQYLED